MMKLVCLNIWVCICLTFLSGCKKASPVEQSSNPSESIYFNSFETPTDTIGWRGYSNYTLYPDAPPGGGKQSFYISGGCFVQHAWTEFLNNSSSNYIILSCWGKRLYRSGFISLSRKNDYLKSINIVVSDSVWTFYTSTDSLFCLFGDTLCLQLFSGGRSPISGGMLVDLIEVKLQK